MFGGGGGIQIGHYIFVQGTFWICLVSEGHFEARNSSRFQVDSKFLLCLGSSLSVQISSHSPKITFFLFPLATNKKTKRSFDVKNIRHEPPSHHLSNNDGEPSRLHTEHASISLVWLQLAVAGSIFDETPSSSRTLSLLRKLKTHFACTIPGQAQTAHTSYFRSKPTRTRFCDLQRLYILEFDKFWSSRLVRQRFPHAILQQRSSSLFN